MPLERMLSTAQLCELLNVGKRTIDNWATQKIGPPFVKVGNARRYRESDVEAWLADREVKTA